MGFFIKQSKLSQSSRMTANLILILYLMLVLHGLFMAPEPKQIINASVSFNMKAMIVV